nr:radial spoke head 10 homolog B isoform X1 [Taeniopygia guttata]XP_030140872.3 radial spoke head 10 homolog B isoform X1 [Taeniopygia guttata]XP_030140873.3 radial spoke head 10 homolog B isoform X1 [Taeniopygia guttata]XP_030140875.3 radial spoke head 10 homolog B isoform X1 [Taeniopygia guttata]XP_041575114.1 radial spoke head 10 homolog B isoform X1 [Taeniopygia guttata]XP_041575115.1 radial spoke head 10 homolog B isoform X1 [Taeniopygia guttata]XP_041575116.1 radial spoke head 10 homol
MTNDKKKDGKKKDAKKDGKKEAVEKSEESLDTTTDSGLTRLSDLWSESLSEEIPAIPEAPDKEVEEPPVQPVPAIHEEPVLAQVIIKSYEGEKVDEFYEGEGFICFEGGNTYKGLFSEGRMNGEGTYTWADGVKYEGTFVKNVPMHNGRYTWNDGSVYEGSIQDGLRHGYGVFRSGTHPISYIGYWCNGKRHGKGEIYYDQEHTSWYSGDWVNNVREGWGFRRYRSGNTYDGQWKKNLRHGCGKMIWLTDDQEYEGQWQCGLQHGSGMHTWFLKKMELSQYPLRNEYVGDFVNGERHGHGTFLYADGAMYSGEWVHNKKHGKGIFFFKNGHKFEGEFVNDRPVKYPARQRSAVKAKNQRATSPRRRSAIKRTRVINALGKTSFLGSDIDLDLPSLLVLFTKKDREEEMQQVELAVLRHISKLRKAYCFYSTLGYAPSSDGTYTLTMLQFWRFLKDCKFHLSSVTLAEIDRLLRGHKPLKQIHDPSDLLLFRTFVSYLVHLAFHIYHEEYKDKVPHLQKCFLEMMSRNVLPSACHVQGILYSDEEFTYFAMSYREKCWEIYGDFCRPCPRSPFEPTLKLRQFLWMLDDLKLLNEQLTAPRVLGILVKVACLPGIYGVNLELEMVFLEFFEALLECALVHVAEDMILKKEAQDNQKRSSFEIKAFSKKTSAASVTEHFPPQPPSPSEDTKPAHQPSLLETVLSFPMTPGESKDDVSLPNKDVKEEQDSCPEKELIDEAKEDKDEQKELFSFWMCQVESFFTTKFFPAFEHEIALRNKIKEKKKQDAELADLRKIQAEELERLIAEKEVEEAKRQEAAVLHGSVQPRKRSSSSWKTLLPRRSLQLKKEAPKREPSPKKRGSQGSRA